MPAEAVGVLPLGAEDRIDVPEQPRKPVVFPARDMGIETVANLDVEQLKVGEGYSRHRHRGSDMLTVLIVDINWRTGRVSIGDDAGNYFNGREGEETTRAYSSFPYMSLTHFASAVLANHRACTRS